MLLPLPPPLVSLLLLLATVAASAALLVWRRGGAAVLRAGAAASEPAASRLAPRGPRARGRLRVFSANAWSGATYELGPPAAGAPAAVALLARALGVGAQVQFFPGEDAARRRARLEALAQEIEGHDPDVVCLSEMMPCPSAAHWLAGRLGMDCCAREALSGLVFGSWRFPDLSEGDAVLARPELALRFERRVRLSGRVFSDLFSLNSGDATQALACSVLLPGREGPEIRAAVVTTHWHAGLLRDDETLDALAALNCSPNARAEALAAIAASTATRQREAVLTATLVQDLRRHFPLIVLAGDLNTTAATPEYALLRRLCSGGGSDGTGGASALHETCPDARAGRPHAAPPTWDPANPNVAAQLARGPEAASQRSEAENQLYARYSARRLKLDHVLWCAQESLAVEAPRHSVVLNDSRRLVPSDHYGLLVDLTWKMSS
jgi:endonuclease/exonuclease/phosphatase family metal-dependent hydrolase